MKDHTNPDPMTGETGSHPLGTGVGAASTGVISTVIGGALGGPLGAVAGAAVGAALGGIVGHEAAEYVNPTYVEIEPRLKESFAERSYAQGRQFEQYRGAYAFGASERGRIGDRPWDAAVEKELQTRWEGSPSNNQMSYFDAREAIRDSWIAADNQHRRT